MVQYAHSKIHKQITNLVCGQQPNLKLKQIVYIINLYCQDLTILNKSRVILADDNGDLVKLR